MFAMVVEALAAAMVAVPKKIVWKKAYNLAEKIRENNSGKIRENNKSSTIPFVRKSCHNHGIHQD